MGKSRTIQPSMSTNTRSFSSNQAGMVSFLVTFIMLLVISLIVVGFTRVTIQNRREALDRQLSTQAFYAAESGINAVVNKYKTFPAILTTKKTSCDPSTTVGGSVLPPNANLDASGATEVKVTCLMIDPLVKNLVSGELKAGTSQVFKIDPRDSNGATTTLNKLIIVWEGRNGKASTAPDPVDSAGSCPTDSTKFAATYDVTGCTYGLMRVDLLRETLLNAQTSADDMAGNTKAVFFQPSTAAPQPAAFNFRGNATQSSPATRKLAQCTGATGVTPYPGVKVDARSCYAEISLQPNAYSAYDIRLSTIYNSTKSLAVYGLNSSDSLVYFAGSQAQIDSTAKAVDVIRRVQVRVPLNNSDGSTVQPFALYTKNALCKRFTVTDSVFEDACSPPGDDDNGDSNYQPCNPATCDTGGGGSGTPKKYWYFKTFIITSDNAEGTIKSCTWHWDDGTPDVTYEGADVGKCYRGQTASHMFKSRPAPPDPNCYEADIKLTIYTTHGVKTASSTMWVPFSPLKHPVCPNKKS